MVTSLFGIHSKLSKRTLSHGYLDSMTYASNTDVSNGAVINKTSTSVDTTKIYIFKNGVFSTGGDSFVPSYTLQNQNGVQFESRRIGE